MAEICVLVYEEWICCKRIGARIIHQNEALCIYILLYFAGTVWVSSTYVPNVHIHVPLQLLSHVYTNRFWNDFSALYGIAQSVLCATHAIYTKIDRFYHCVHKHRMVHTILHTYTGKNGEWTDKRTQFSLRFRTMMNRFVQYRLWVLLLLLISIELCSKNKESQPGNPHS